MKKITKQSTHSIDRYRVDRFRMCGIFLLMICLCAMFFCRMNVYAEGISGTCGKNTSWTLDESTGVLDIYGTGAIRDYDTSKDDFPTYYDYLEEIKSVVIHEGITGVGENAFIMMFFTSVSIPSTVEYIGWDAFYNTSLKKVTLSEGLKTIEEGAFSATCITSITIPSSVKKLGLDAFGYCSSLKTAYFKGTKTSISSTAFDGNASYSSTNANIIIYGYKGSTAQKFATKYKMGFRTIGGKIPSSTKITSLSKNKSRAKSVIRFKKVSGAYKYEVQLSRSAKFSGAVLQAFSTKTKLSLKGIKTSYVGKTIYARVRVYKKTKGKISVSNWSKVKKTKIKK